MAFLFEPQNLYLNGEVVFLLLMIAGLTTYGISQVGEFSAFVLFTLLWAGAYAGNVVVRALELVSAGKNVNVDTIVHSSYAAFGGMFVVMAIWFLCKLVLPALMPQRKVVRPNQPQGVVGGSS